MPGAMPRSRTAYCREASLQALAPPPTPRACRLLPRSHLPGTASRPRPPAAEVPVQGPSFTGAVQDLDPPATRVPAQGHSVGEEMKDYVRPSTGQQTYTPPARGKVIKAVLRHCLPPHNPPTRGKAVKVVLQPHLLPYALRLARRLLHRSNLPGAMQRSRQRTTTVGIVFENGP